jgi:signal transduction histidine kinase
VTIHALLAVISASLAIYVAALFRRFSLAPGWRDQGWFSLAALSVAVFAALDVSTTLPVPDRMVIWCCRVQALLAGIHVYAWLRYSDHHAEAHPGPRGRALRLLPIGFGALALVPGMAFRDVIATYYFAPWDCTFKVVVPTLFGSLLMGAVLALLALVAARFAQACRRGVPYAGVHLASLLFLLAMATCDVLTTSGLLQLPFLIDFGFILPIGAVAYAMSARLARDARSLELLRERLESLVELRTRALAVAQEQLHRSEKLAAIGRLAAGVAHEVNSPAAAAAANLRYLMEGRTGEGAWPEDAVECVGDSLNSIERIQHIVRQLLDAGRLSDAPTGEAVRLGAAVGESVRLVRTRAGQRIRLVAEVDEHLYAIGNEGVLVRVLVNLLVNAVQAIPAERSDGLVRVTARSESGRVSVSVEDNGVGLPAEARRRLFEPFFTTRPVGHGAGLGLAVSRALVQGLGGELRVEDGPTGGVRAVIELTEIRPDLAPSSIAVA